MKGLMILAFALAYANADVVDNKQAIIRDQQFDIEPDGSAYRFSWDTDNDINVQVSGKLNNADSETPDHEQSGNVAYKSKEGVPISWTYKAGIRGYEPQGDIIPTPPPTPDAILRLLEFIRSKPLYKAPESSIRKN